MQQIKGNLIMSDKPNVLHYYTTLHPLNGLFSRTTWVSQH